MTKRYKLILINIIAFFMIFTIIVFFVVYFFITSENKVEDDTDFGPREDQKAEFMSLLKKSKELLFERKTPDKEDIEEAMEYLNKALEMKKDAHWLYGDLGYAKYLLGDYEDAIKCLNKAQKLERRPIATAYYDWKADSYEKIGMYGLARKERIKSFFIKTAGVICFYCGRILHKVGVLNVAVKLYEIATEIEQKEKYYSFCVKIFRDLGDEDTAAIYAEFEKSS